MHVLIVPSWYPVRDNPIRGVFFKEQALALQKNGFKVTVAFPEIWSIKSIGKNKETKGFHLNVEDGIRTYRYKSYNYFPRVPHVQGRLYLNFLRKLYNHVVENEGKPDIIHAHSALWGGWAATKISEKSHIPLLITEHSSAYDRDMIKPYQEKYINYTFNISRKVIVVGPSLERQIQKYVNKEKIKLIPNIVNIDNFKIGTIKKNTKRFRFLSIGFLSYNKGMDVLLKSFARAFKNKEEVELIIGGDGEEFENLISLAKELGIFQQVRFLGRLTREEVYAEMHKCDAFVLASRFETFGVVFIEALACGKPIISTKSGGPEIIVNKSNGVLVEKENTHELAIALKDIYKNNKNYSPSLIRKKCEEAFSEKAIVDQIARIYKEILNAY
ncbi:glycosyltransferase family 4 protein [Halobacillus litoralis]|uniref:glycosyltransferase family 4 protein n=1 Tax=Halobacillus litoralis TaxID=45668 RepID=UPI00249277A0|nr:glycosyltransferase family 4 protein [Halobacillus litoralis]